MAEHKSVNEIELALKEEKEKLLEEIKEAAKRKKTLMNPEKELNDNELLK
jgi:hypothetical protein